MQVQHEITEPRPLLDQRGNISEPGYAKKLLWDYDRKSIKAGAFRIKEWDYYLINNDRFAVALTVADNSYMGLDSISFLNFEEGWEKTVSPMQLLTNGRKDLPSTSVSGDVITGGKDYEIKFLHTAAGRTLEFRLENFQNQTPIYGKIDLSAEPVESMVIATPFEKEAHFYYNQKINCMRAEGYVMVNNHKYLFRPEESFAVLDWGRGVWTYKNTWYWGSASGLADGVPFGFNIGYGFGDTSAATENMLFYNGKAHKLNEVTFHIPKKENGKEDYLKPWKFSSDDGRFKMDFVPVLDRASCTDIVLIKSDQHQVFGRFHGKAILDDGTVITIRNFMGFTEKVFNKW